MKCLLAMTPCYKWFILFVVSFFIFCSKPGFYDDTEGEVASLRPFQSGRSIAVQRR